ncbi:MAG: phosphate--acyl-ACP acyltransferase [Collinsella intestinalis]
MTKRNASFWGAVRSEGGPGSSAGSTAITAAAPPTSPRSRPSTARIPLFAPASNAYPNAAVDRRCDMGANPDVEPWDMVRFAQMGAAYAACVLGVDEPSVGLLSNGTEEHKGSAFTQSCYPLMAEHVPGFAGNCEGGDITSGSVDVVVCNGFDGNIALKSIEGAAKFMMGELKAGMTANLKGKVAALLMRNMLRALKHKLSGDAKGGAILLGLRGVVMIGHETSAEAVKNGTLACAEAVRARLVERVRESMGLEA